jgi:hypothetical protein
MVNETQSFQEIWNSRHFQYPFRHVKDTMKAAQALFNTMQYYQHEGGEGLKDSFVRLAVIPLMPNPNVLEEWPDQQMFYITRRILCGHNVERRYFFAKRTSIAAIACIAVFAETRDAFDFICRGNYPSAISDVLRHLWKARVAVNGVENHGNKPSPNEYRKMLRWMYRHLRPHHEKLMGFLNTQDNLTAD